ncbi:9984_t:CDS:2 [Funneliformis geosporum]|uniref:9984_t:CDS:1 n=1 Tax=Funneliformis geosporum TaxID=1117311 RepID=A0A9W4X863_9GLOM|nr:9984_t:CDS:2 [Funneliformis geosporum]
MNQVFTGTVVALKNPKTATVELVSIKIHSKYFKPQKIVKTKKVHYEETEFPLQLGDKVKIKSDRPRSKTKRFLKIRKRRSNLIKGSMERPRVVLCVSNRYLRVQAIDDIAGHTIAFASTENFKEKSDYSRKNKEYAKKLGIIFADKLKKDGVKNIIFDRNAQKTNIIGENPQLAKGEKEKISEVKPEGKKHDLGSDKSEKKEYERERYTHAYLREVLKTTRPVKVTKGGRRFSFTSLVLTQDKEKNAVACARGKSKEAMDAFKKAYRKTQKELIAHFSTPSRTIPREKAYRKTQKELIAHFSTPSRTIPRDIVVDYKATRLILKPTPSGSGIKASETLSILFKYLGIKDKKKIVGRGIGSGRGKTCGRGGKGQTARTGGGTPPGFEGGQTKVYLRFPKRGGGFKTASKTAYQIINLANLERDEQVVKGQEIHLPKVKILGEGELTKNLIIHAADFSQEAQEKITKAGGQFQTITAIRLDKIVKIFQNAEFSQPRKKTGSEEWKVMVGEQEFSINYFRNYVKKLIESKELKEKWLPNGQKQVDLLRKLKELIQAETTTDAQ